MTPPTTMWLRSTFCSDSACIEVAAVPDGVAVRNSSDPQSGVLRFTRTEWDAFLDGVRAGEFLSL